MADTQDKLITAEALKYVSDELSGKISDKVSKSNITLEQHTDGLIYIFVDGAPVGNGVELGTIVEGDVIGTLDENNNIILTGALADGTYTLKYENEDGSYTDVGTLTVSATEEPEEVINQIPISTDADGNLFVGTNGEAGYKTGYRLSLSSGGETDASNYECTGFIPVKYGDELFIKNVDLTQENSTNMVFYDSEKNPIAVNNPNYGTTLYWFFVTNGTKTGDVYSNTIETKENIITLPENFNGFIRIGSTSITDESILTVNQEIV